MFSMLTIVNNTVLSVLKLLRKWILVFMVKNKICNYMR